MKDSIRKILLVVIALVVVGFPFLEKVVDLVTDWWWYRSLGYSLVFSIRLETQLLLGIVFGLLFFLIVYINIRLARAAGPGSTEPGRFAWEDFPYYRELKIFLNRFLLVAVALIALFFGTWAATQWDVFLRFTHASSFGLADPLFHRDIGFYVFKWPFYEFLQAFGMAAIVLSILVTFLIHLTGGQLHFARKGLSLGRPMRRHLFVLLGLMFLLLTLRFQFNAWDLLYSARGVVYGAGYTDVHAELPLLRFLAAASAVTALLCFVQVFVSGYKPVLVGVGLILLGTIGQSFYPAVVQRFEVVPNEFTKEKPFLVDAVHYTRRAYDVDTVDEREFPASHSLTSEELKRENLTIKNIRLWDYEPLLQTYAQLQEIRTYYDFVDVDNDRYTINGEYRQVMLSPRELSSENLPSRTWINEHLMYTHGYGLCMGPVNMISNEGLPQFFIKDIPPVSTANIQVKQPGIYYGELSNDYCFVKTRSREFDYPYGDENRYTTYQGSGGVQLDGFFKKLMFAMRFGDSKFLLADDLTPQSRLMFHRRVVERVERLIPMASVDQNPYMVIDRGRLFWIVDAYTTTNLFPYSEPRAGVGNYVRNSIKAVVDAYNGDVHLYVSTLQDPLVQTLEKIYPGLLRPLSEMPASLRAHIRVPQFFFSVQASIYATFHMTDPQVFFNKEDLWKIPESAVSGRTQVMRPYYIIMKLPVQREAEEAASLHHEEEFLLMIPFTPAKKNNMIAWMAARCDAPNYGKLVVYNFPKDKLVYGPQQVESRIDQEAEISQQLTLWNQGGSQVLRGSLLVIPIQQSLLYVQPLYLSASQGGRLPELKRVIVAYSDSIAMGQNLEEALNLIFSPGSEGKAVQPEVVRPAATGRQPPETGLKEAIREASDAFDRAQNALKNGDWAGYGKEMKKLEEALKRLRRNQ